MDAADLDALEIGCYDLGCFDTHSVLHAAVLDATVLDVTILDVANTPYEGDFGCSLEVMNDGCCGFGCCVNWMLRSWMLQYSPGRVAASRRIRSCRNGPEWSKLGGWETLAKPAGQPEVGSSDSGDTASERRG